MIWNAIFAAIPAAIIIALIALLRQEYMERQRLEAENWLREQIILMLREELRVEQIRHRLARPLILNGRLYVSYRPSRQSFNRN
ncbi:MAG: hypothetical protein J7M34_05775 [Anaerolineae bacterium]|nr:hypothetical protein [Anaerolineae bacterium]